MSPWHDWWGTLVVAGISAAFAANAFRVGRHGYRTHLYLALGNFGISLAAYVGNTEGDWPSILEIGYFLLITLGSFFLTIGILTIFREPKRVKCFRCEYVSTPHETDEPATGFDQAEWNEFRRMHWAGEAKRKETREGTE